MAPSSRATIMVIGGDSNFCYLMQRYIRQSDHQIAVTHQSENALELAHRERPAAIILEIDHPGSMGWSVLRALKADVETSSIPVVLCSWKDDESDYRGTDLKGEVYLRKPVLYEDFKAVLDQLGILSERK